MLSMCQGLMRANGPEHTRATGMAPSVQLETTEQPIGMAKSNSPDDEPEAVKNRAESALIEELPIPEDIHLPFPPIPELSVDVRKLHPLSPEVLRQQATINIGMIGHVAHGKSTVVKAISGVTTVRFKNEFERNITIKLGYANAKVGHISRFA